MKKGEPAYTILHNTDGDKKTFLHSDSELIEFVEKIVKENGDENFSILGVSDAMEYLEDYCPNLTLLD